MGISETLPHFVPSETRVRDVYVRDHVPSTVVIQSDWVPAARKDELFLGTRIHEPSSGNVIRYFDGARQAFSAMADEIDRAGAGDYIIILGWALVPWTELLPDSEADLEGPSPPPRNAPGNWAPTEERLQWLMRRPKRAVAKLNAAAARGAKVFVLLWAGSENARWARAIPGLGSTSVTGNWNTQINTMTQRAVHPQNAENFKVVLDGNVPTTGAHHQKLMLVHRHGRTTAFYGGMDINPDRYLGLYDLHAWARGPICADLFELVRARVMAPPIDLTRAAVSSSLTEVQREFFRSLAAPVSPPAPTARSHALLTHSLADQRSDVFLNLKHIVSHAQRYIFIVDQYFWTQLWELADESMVDLLVDRLPSLQHLTILTNDDEQQRGEHAVNRHLALQRLLRRADNYRTAPRLHRTDPRYSPAALSNLARKIGVFRYPGRFVHPKLWIVDDEVIVCGSANFAQRSYDTDTELMVSEVDRVEQGQGPASNPAWHQLGLSAARQLRLRLWSDLLNVPMERLVDPIASAAYWKRIELANVRFGSCVAPYKIDGVLWSTAVRTRTFSQGLQDQLANGSSPSVSL